MWQYFGLEAGEHNIPKHDLEDQPVCRKCNKQIRAKHGNTSNLLAHLRDHHPEEYAEASKFVHKGEPSTASRQPTLLESVQRGSMYDPKSAQARDLNRAVGYFLAKDIQPLYTLEKPGFQQLVSKLNPKYNLPSRKYFTETEIPRLYNEVRDTIVKPKLTEIMYFAATTDLWTSRANHPYLSLTVHFVTSSWDLQAFTLETVPMFEDHTGQNIADAVVDILDNWNLEGSKLIATTTDNGSNFAFKSLEWTRISCFGHNLDLAVNKVLL